MHPGKSQAMWAGNDEMWKPSVGYTAIGGVKSVWAASRMLGESDSNISQRPYQSNFMERLQESRFDKDMIRKEGPQNRNVHTLLLFHLASGLLLLPLLTPIDAVRWASWCTMSLTMFALMLPVLHLLGAPALPAPTLLSLGSLIVYCFLVFVLVTAFVLVSAGVRVIFILVLLLLLVLKEEEAVLVLMVVVWYGFGKCLFT